MHFGVRAPPRRVLGTIPEPNAGPLSKHAPDHLAVYPAGQADAECLYIERFNRTPRQEWLDMHLFESIEHTQLLVTLWLWQYNNQRPHSAIGGIPPRQLLQAA